MNDHLTDQQLDEIVTMPRAEDIDVLVSEVRRLRAQPSAIEKVEQAFGVELNDDRALTLLDALIVLRSKLPCTCARSQGLHETGCRRYVPGHDLLSPARRLARAREALRPAVSRPVPAATDPEPETGTGQCGHDDYHEAHEWHGRPGMWCPGHSLTDDDRPVPAAHKEQQQ